MAKHKISRPYNGDKIEITKNEYDKTEKVFNEINRKVDHDILSYSIDHTTKHVSICRPYWEGITFESPQFPSILGFKGIRDGMGYHITIKNSVISIALSHRKTSYPTTLFISLPEIK